MEKVKILVYASIGCQTSWNDSYGRGVINHFAWTEIVEQETHRKTLLCAVAAIAAQGKDDFDWRYLHGDICAVVDMLIKPTDRPQGSGCWMIREAVKVDGKIFIDISVLNVL